MLMNPSCNCLSLRQAARRVTQLYDQALAPLDIRATQLSMLRTIDRLGPVALNALAEAMVMDRATMGHNVRPLAARGLIRLAVGSDRRSREVALTPAGRAVLARSRKLWRKAQTVFEKKIGVETAATLRSLLHRVSAADFSIARTPGSVESSGYRSQCRRR
jgi:DNA-binding MarR family transcriptional regulator